MSQERIFEAKKVKLNYLEYGSPSGEPLMMLHGGAWCWQEYLSLIPSLGERWHVYALDLRGNGCSGWVPKQYRLKDFVEDNAEFLNQLDAPAVLVGHSIGAVVALMLAAEFPDKVKALILEDPVLTLDNYRKVIDESRTRFALWLDLKKRATSELDLGLRLSASYKDIAATSAWLSFFARCLRQLDPTFFDTLLNHFESFIEGYDYHVIFRNITCPALILRGELSLGAVMTDDEIRWLRTNCANVKCALIDGVGHLLHLEDHGQAPVLREMMTFLDQIYSEPETSGVWNLVAS